MLDVSNNLQHHVKEILGRLLEFFLVIPKEVLARRVDDLLERIELPRDYGSRYP